jgi:hypothetical protein
MRSSFGWFFVGLVACTNVGTTQDSGAPPPGPTPVVTPTPPPATPVPPTPEPTPATTAAVDVQMTAATLADDCGGPPAAPKAKEKAKERSAISGKADKAKRACEQSSMQLSLVAAAGGAASQIAVKKVELFDDKGALIGELTARAPSVWDASGMYQVWDQSIAPGQELSVSYALSQPPWNSVPDRRNRGYVLKAVITVGGGEHAVQRDVQVDAATILPPNVKT